MLSLASQMHATLTEKLRDQMRVANRIREMDPLRLAVLRDGKVTGMGHKLNEVTDFIAAGMDRADERAKPHEFASEPSPGLVLSALTGERFATVVPTDRDAVLERHPWLRFAHEMLGVNATHLVSQLTYWVDREEEFVGVPPIARPGSREQLVPVTAAAVGAARRLLLVCTRAIAECSRRRWQELATVPWDRASRHPDSWDDARLTVAVLAVWRAGCRVGPGGRLVGETEWPRVNKDALLDLVRVMHYSGEQGLAARPDDVGAGGDDPTYLSVLRPQVRRHLGHPVDWQHWHKSVTAAAGAGAPGKRKGPVGY